MRYIVDTREQHPYAFEGAEVLQKALPTGDYSVEGLEEVITLERKSLDDYVHTIFHAWDRFRNELARMRHYEYSAIIVEATLEDVFKRRYTSQVHPSSVVGRTNSIAAYWQVPVFFWSNRQYAQVMAMNLLRQFAEFKARQERSN